MLTIWEFGVEWCSGCKILAPIVEGVVKDYYTVILKKVDIENDSESYCEKFNIKNLPTLVFEGKDKNFEKRLVGTVPASKIILTIEEYNNL